MTLARGCRHETLRGQHGDTLANLNNGEIAFFSLQRGPGAADAGALGLSERFTDRDPEIADFADTAEVVSMLESGRLSGDTSLVHLTGALARPVWTLVPFAPGWRRILEREDGPWYPSLRLFRQARWGEWAPVIEPVRDELVKALGFANGAPVSTAD